MNLAQFLAHFDRISDAPDAVPRLRRFILELAVRGKLVEQDPRDEPALELLGRIETEKLKLIKEGKLKRQEPLSPVNEDELPFPVPHGWQPARLAVIAACLDYMREPINSTERNQRIAGKNPSELFPYFGATQQQGWIDSYIFDEELVLLGEDGVPFFDELRSKAYLISGKTWVNNHAHVFRGILVSHAFLAHYLNTFDYKGRVAGATRSKLNQAKAVDIPIILPPLDEQQRIVAKVDELMVLCDRLKAAQVERESRRDRLTTASLYRLNNGAAADAFRDHGRFYFSHLPRLTTRQVHIQQLRQTILNLAVRGKLVHQDHNDEPAFELLERVAVQKTKAGNAKTGRDWIGDIAKPVDEAFVIPKGWVWTRIANTVERVTVGYVGPMKDQYVQDGIPFLRSQNVRANRFREDGLISISPKFHQAISKSALAPGDVVVVRSGNVGTACVIPPSLLKANCSDLVVVKHPIAVHPAYLCFYLNSLASTHIEAGTVGVALTHFNTKSVATMPLPLPPLPEQHRIVARVDELMALCDRLEAQLNTTQTESRRLLEAVLHDALAWQSELEQGVLR